MTSFVPFVSVVEYEYDYRNRWSIYIVEAVLKICVSKWHNPKKYDEKQEKICIYIKWR